MRSCEKRTREEDYSTRRTQKQGKKRKILHYTGERTSLERQPTETNREEGCEGSQRGYSVPACHKNMFRQGTHAHSLRGTSTLRVARREINLKLPKVSERPPTLLDSSCVALCSQLQHPGSQVKSKAIVESGAVDVGKG